jgi:hypothetical protein
VFKLFLTTTSGGSIQGEQRNGKTHDRCIIDRDALVLVNLTIFEVRVVLKLFR